MKELTSYNRVAGYLNKVFDLLNEEFFENTLSRPTITIQSTPRAYGHFSLREDTWVSKLGGTHEINIGAGTLSRPIEEVAATLLHEMVHYYNFENGVQDCSRGNTYHNRRFKASAEAHGLTVEHTDKYGWSRTSPSDALLDFIVRFFLNDKSVFCYLESFRKNLVDLLDQILGCVKILDIAVFILQGTKLADVRLCHVRVKLSRSYCFVEAFLSFFDGIGQTFILFVLVLYSL